MNLIWIRASLLWAADLRRQRHEVHWLNMYSRESISERLCNRNVSITGTICALEISLPFSTAPYDQNDILATEVAAVMAVQLHKHSGV